MSEKEKAWAYFESRANEVFDPNHNPEDPVQHVLDRMFARSILDILNGVKVEKPKLSSIQIQEYGEKIECLFPDSVEISEKNLEKWQIFLELLMSEIRHAIFNNDIGRWRKEDKSDVFLGKKIDGGIILPFDGRVFKIEDFIWCFDGFLSPEIKVVDCDRLEVAHQTMMDKTPEVEIYPKTYLIVSGVSGIDEFKVSKENLLKWSGGNQLSLWLKFKQLTCTPNGRIIDREYERIYCWDDQKKSWEIDKSNQDQKW